MVQVGKSKGSMPNNLGLSGFLKDVVVQSLDQHSSIKRDAELAGIDVDIAHARARILTLIRLSIINGDEYCCIWNIPNNDLGVKYRFKNSQSHIIDVRYIKGKSRVFYSLCVNEKLIGGKKFPIVVRAKFNNAELSFSIAVDLKKLKEIII